MLPGPGAAAVTPSDDRELSSTARKRRKPSLSSSPADAMTRELSADQKATVKLHVTRESPESLVKCCYCEKEITSRNVDRWASHLRGCSKTPEDVKALIQPARVPPSSPVPPVTTASVAAAATAAAVASATIAQSAHPPPPSHPVAPAAAATAVAAAPPAVEIKMSPFTAQALAATSTYSEVFKVHVSKDYMKFNAAHFIAYKVHSHLGVVNGGVYCGCLRPHCA